MLPCQKESLIKILPWINQLKCNKNTFAHTVASTINFRNQLSVFEKLFPVLLDRNFCLRVKELRFAVTPVYRFAVYRVR